MLSRGKKKIEITDLFNLKKIEESKRERKERTKRENKELGNNNHDNS